MYTCQIHNWQSNSFLCPLCMKVVPATGTKTTISSDLYNYIVVENIEAEKNFYQLGFNDGVTKNEIISDNNFKELLQLAALAKDLESKCEAKDIEIKELREALYESIRNPKTSTGTVLDNNGNWSELTEEAKKEFTPEDSLTN